MPKSYILPWPKPWLLLSGGFLLLGMAQAAIGAPKPVAKPVQVKAVQTKPLPAKAVPAKPIAAPVGPSPREVYTAQCSSCHALKPVSALPDPKAWVSLLYTSGCPEVSIKLAETQRRAIRAFVEGEFKVVK